MKGKTILIILALFVGLALVQADATCEATNNKIDLLDIHQQLMQANIYARIDMVNNQTLNQIQKSELGMKDYIDKDFQTLEDRLTAKIQTETSPYKLTIPILLTCFAMFCSAILYGVIRGR